MERFRGTNNKLLLFQMDVNHALFLDDETIQCGTIREINEKFYVIRIIAILRQRCFRRRTWRLELRNLLRSLRSIYILKKREQNSILSNTIIITEKKTMKIKVLLITEQLGY